MNRPGQPPQRPPNLGPNPAIGGPFRTGPYPSYGLPHRNVGVLQGGTGTYAPTLQQQVNQRTSQAQTMIQQATTTQGFIQRSQPGFGYNSGIGAQHQTSSVLQPPSSQPQQPNGSSSSTSLSSHIPPSSLTSNAPPSVSSTSELLDPNDFPALGSVPVASSTNASSAASNGAAQVTSSYASQAGTGVQLGSSGAIGSGASATVAVSNSSTQAREFTQDDFPALGNHSQTQTQDHSHPPGLNGFQPNNEHRTNLLGSLSGTNPPGMLHLSGQQSRGVHLGFGQGLPDAEKVQQRSNYAIKLNQASHAAWSSANAPQTQTVPTSFNAPTSSTTTTQNGTHPPNPTSSSQHLAAPPGVSVPSGSTPYNQPVQAQAPVQGQGTSHPHPPNALPNAYPSNGDATAANAVGGPSPQQPLLTHPQTPAQQILMSAADRWGLLGLLATIKGVGRDVDGGLSSIGTDLGTMGLDMSYQGNLYSTFITPWADQSAAHTVEPDFHLPPCYSVQPPPPGPNKAAAFSDETLFFMFYSHPRDALQEIAAQELWNRNWRYHKELRLWITKETGTAPSQKVPGGEQGAYTVWEPENWCKERREMAVLYADLEEKNHPAFLPGPGLVLAQSTPQGLGQQQQQQQAQAQAQGPVQQTQRGAFPMAIGGL